MGSELIAYDSVEAWQVLEDDYIRFVYDGETHEGLVLNVEDYGQFVEINLRDEVEGDKINYVVVHELEVELMTREQ
jgi:hypothetical protein